MYNLPIRQSFLRETILWEIAHLILYCMLKAASSTGKETASFQSKPFQMEKRIIKPLKDIMQLKKADTSCLITAPTQ